MNLSDIPVFLPQYLSDQSQKALFSDVVKFTSAESLSQYYASAFADSNTLFQGDCLEKIPFLTLPTGKIRDVRAMILSNSCDIQAENVRLFSSMVCFAPVIELQKYLENLERKGIPKERLVNHEVDIKAQRITQILYLPPGQGLQTEAITFLDRICHVSVDFIASSNALSRRVLSLSNFGFYLFLLKLSIHFTRIQENVDRV